MVYLKLLINKNEYSNHFGSLNIILKFLELPLEISGASWFQLFSNSSGTEWHNYDFRFWPLVENEICKQTLKSYKTQSFWKRLAHLRSHHFFIFLDYTKVNCKLKKKIYKFQLLPPRETDLYTCTESVIEERKHTFFFNSQILTFILYEGCPFWAVVSLIVEIRASILLV